MGIFDDCLIACDVDGTLMDNGYINSKNGERIKYFLSEGGKFSLSTGRSQAALTDVFKVVTTLSPSVLANGTVIYDFDKKENLCFFSINDADKRLPELIFEKYPDIGIEIHSGCDVFNAAKSEESIVHERYEHFISKAITFKEAYKYEWNKVLYLFNSIEELKEAEPILNSLNTGNSCIIESSAIIEGKRRYYCEQVPKGVSKASSIKKLCEMQNIKKGGLFAIGDYYNDLEIIKQADISACPENAPDDVKQFATVTVCNVQDGAVADFIDYLKTIFENERK